MTTIVNTPTPRTESSNGIVMIIGLVVLVGVLYMFFIYGLPLVRNMGGSPQINVPEKIDVNINQQDK